MYKRTASSDQFFHREAMHSTKGSRRGYDLLDHGVNAIEELTDEEKRASLVAVWKNLHARICALPKNDPIRKELGMQQLDVQNRINAIRPKLKAPGAKEHFIDVVRERVTKAQFDAWMNEAAARAAAKSGRTFMDWSLVRAGLDGTKNT